MKLIVDFDDAARLSEPRMNYLYADFTERRRPAARGEPVVTRTVSKTDALVQFRYLLDPVSVRSGDTLDVELTNFQSFEFTRSERKDAGIEWISLEGVSDNARWNATVTRSADLLPAGSKQVDTYDTTGSSGKLLRSIRLEPIGRTLLLRLEPFQIVDYAANLVVRADPAEPPADIVLRLVSFSMHGDSVTIGNYGGDAFRHQGSPAVETVTSRGPGDGNGRPRQERSQGRGQLHGRGQRRRQGGPIRRD